MRYLFTSDLHMGHFNIIKYVNRPFKSLEEMDKTLIANWNQRVKSDDIIFHVGDFSFRNTPRMVYRGEGNIYKADYYEKQLNGKIIFLKGSHDSNNSCKTCIRNIKIMLGGHLINLVHDPKYVNYNCDFNLTGHVHCLWKFKRFMKGNKTVDAINVGTDVWNFRPIVIEEILKEYSKWKKNFKLNGNEIQKQL